MSRPQVQFQLLCRPASLAGGRRPFFHGRTIARLAGPVASSALSHSLDMVQPGRIGGEFFKDQSTSRDAFLGHACVSPAGVEDHSTPEPEACASTKLGHLIQGAGE